MKKIIYLFLLAILMISFGCNKDEVLTEDEVLIISKRTGFEDDNGNIYDGSNGRNTTPTENYWTLLTEYPSSTTAAQKAAIRIPYQISGQLLYFEQCPNDPNKELWYMYNNSGNIFHKVDPLGNPKDDDPIFPKNTFPGNGMDFGLNQSCFD
jgi:hypothetical protein